jgi:acyl carrier protein
MDLTLEETIKRVMADILNIDFKDIGEDTSAHNTDSWDSANHIQLILALEQEFSISFDVAEFESMLSFPDIVSVVQTKL